MNLLEKAQGFKLKLNEVLFDQEKLLEMVTLSIFGGGHILLEGLPGLGKTVLAKGIAQLLGLENKRIQFTPDLMPSDITGTLMLKEKGGDKVLEFMPGPVFCQFLLADEINRASPKTQAALLEAMAEGCVTQHNKTRQLPKPFIVMATQNPIDLEGTHKLPEAQLDRFAVRCLVDPPSEDAVFKILSQRKKGSPPNFEQILNGNNLLAIQDEILDIFLPEGIARFIAKLLGNSHNHEYLNYGFSPRAAIWLTRLAKASAYLDGRQGIGFEDVKKVAPYILNHRLYLNYQAQMEGVKGNECIFDMVKRAEEEVLL